MTPEALALRNRVVQTIRERVLSPRYQLWRQEPAGNVLWWRDMMILGSVLLPPPESTGLIAPRSHLDVENTRFIIDRELKVVPRILLYKANVAQWEALIPDIPGTGDIDALGRRFYALNAAWEPTKIPTAEERDAQFSPYHPAHIVMPDLGVVSHRVRLKAIGC